MTTLYKLTDESGQTHGGTQWGENVTHTASGEGGLCGPGWLHAYTHPLLAVLLNPIHGNFDNPRLWLAEGDVGKTDRGLKVGCTSLTTIHTMPLPVITREQRIRFGILCAKAVCTDPRWNHWADRWLSREDRTREAAADAAAAEAAGAAWAAGRAAEAAEEAVEPVDLIDIAEEACA